MHMAEDELSMVVAAAGEDAANVAAHACRALLAAVRSAWPGGWRSGLAAGACSAERFAWAQSVGCEWDSTAPRRAAIWRIDAPTVRFEGYSPSVLCPVELGEWFDDLSIYRPTRVEMDAWRAQADGVPDVYAAASYAALEACSHDAIELEGECRPDASGRLRLPHYLDTVTAVECAGEAALLAYGQLMGSQDRVPFADGRLVFSSPLFLGYERFHLAADQPVRYRGLRLRDAQHLTRRLRGHGSVACVGSCAVLVLPLYGTIAMPLRMYDWRVAYPRRWRAAGRPRGGLNGLALDLGSATPDYLRERCYDGQPIDEWAPFRAAARQPERDGVVWDVTFPASSSGSVVLSGMWDALLEARCDVDAALETTGRDGAPVLVPFVAGQLPLLGPLLVWPAGVRIRTRGSVACRVATLGVAKRDELFCAHAPHVDCGAYRLWPGPVVRL
jgi:hypothetical protein